jgi:hypothetical protein
MTAQAFRSSRTRRWGSGARVVAMLLTIGVSLGADAAKGTITHQTKGGAVVVTIQHAYLVKGPDVVSGKTIRRIVLSVADVAAALKGCNTMMCSDGGIGEGMTIDLDAGPRVNYWFVANDQRVQYSGTADPASLKLSTDTPKRVAGTWNLDAKAAGGPVITVEFDASLVKEITGK